MLTRNDIPSVDGINIIKVQDDKTATRQRQSKRSATSQSWQWLYKTKRYRVRRKIFMAKNPICVRCGKVATDLDHKKPHKGDEQLFFDESNWQALCGTCHRRKTASEDM